jgi:hypothetical protein
VPRQEECRQEGCSVRQEMSETQNLLLFYLFNFFICYGCTPLL